MGAGGLEHIAIDLCRKVDKKKYEVSILCLEACEPEYETRLAKYGIPVFVVKKSKKVDIRFYSKVFALINKLGIDVVHIHSCIFDSAICTLFSKVKGTIFTAHGLPVATDIISTCQDFIGLRRVGRIVAVSDEISEYLIHVLKVPKEKIDVIYNGIDVSEFKPAKNNKCSDLLKARLNINHDSVVIGTVGRLEPVKNYSMLIRSFKRLKSMVDKQLHLVFVGDGILKGKLESLSRELGIERSVSFLGVRDDVTELLDIFDIFVLTSLTEGISVSLLEAQSKGIPSVVTDVGGNSCVIDDGVNGFLCELNNSDLFCEKLKKLLEEERIYELFSKSSREQILKRFNSDNMIKLYEEIYSSLCY